jgi:hypothetical protein
MRLSNQALDDDTPTASASGLGGRMHLPGGRRRCSGKAWT